VVSLTKQGWIQGHPLASNVGAISVKGLSVPAYRYSGGIFKRTDTSSITQFIAVISPIGSKANGEIEITIGKDLLFVETTITSVSYITTNTYDVTIQSVYPSTNHVAYISGGNNIAEVGVITYSFSTDTNGIGTVRLDNITYFPRWIGIALEYPASFSLLRRTFKWIKINGTI